MNMFAEERNTAPNAVIGLDVEARSQFILRTYLHQPEVIAEICSELGVPSRPNGYRHWW